MKIRWTCSRNFAHDFARWTLTANPFWAGDPGGAPDGDCPGEHKVINNLGRDEPKENWPKCDECGDTMLPFEAIYEDGEVPTFKVPG